uniref:Polypeptide N-acetylgalactosaminyltransferase 5 n=1 Tax=Malurus cyaneus samueli TaxID=2593467 RepID=A0A8C5TJI5_9PASS
MLFLLGQVLFLCFPGHLGTVCWAIPPAGGLFSIDKKYFFELGMYDPGLDVWGGENMEISFKAWMCGGEIEIVPCSRVGHIFRNDNPYSFPKDRVSTVERNLARVAEVWLDEYKELFYGHAYHLLLKNVDVGDLSQQMRLREKLRCQSFRWYLENVYPDLEAPLVKASGLLLNAALAGCIAVEGASLAFGDCDPSFNYTWLRLIQHGELCPCQRSLATVRPGLVSDPLEWQLCAPGWVMLICMVSGIWDGFSVGMGWVSVLWDGSV